MKKYKMILLIYFFIAFTYSRKVVVQFKNNLDLYEWKKQNNLNKQKEFNKNSIVINSNQLKNIPSGAIIENEITFKKTGTFQKKENNLVQANSEYYDNYRWNLDRIDQESLPLNHMYDTNSTNFGDGVNVYIIDSGIYISHEQFEGRASWGANFIDSIDTDCDGHGTHVAGTVMSRDYGVAKSANAIAVKVLDCDGNGNTGSVMQGLDWVVQHTKTTGKKSVINMSIGSDSKSTILNNYVDSIRNQGILIAVAAGNEDMDACNSSPAGASRIVTVASSTNIDSRSSFSNWGNCVDIFAPGSNIRSTYLNGNLADASGTSMASPHLAGAFALYWSDHLTLSADAIQYTILNTASLDQISDTQGTVNKLLRINSNSTVDYVDTNDDKKWWENIIIILAAILFIIVVITICIKICS